MPNNKSKAKPTVDEYVASLDSPLKEEVEMLRCIIKASVNGVGEEIKWNAPSFYTSEHFATMRLNGKEFLQLILHLGAKKSKVPDGAITDQESLLTWLAEDRACVSFPQPGAVSDKSEALKKILVQWVRHVPREAL